MLRWILWRWMSKSQKFIETAGARTRFAIRASTKRSHVARSAATNAKSFSDVKRLPASRKKLGHKDNGTMERNVALRPMPRALPEHVRAGCQRPLGFTDRQETKP